ncbi:MAG TPA: hypothetical protein VGC99_29085 [Candidatus Tectomicrobia bacterium]
MTCPAHDQRSLTDLAYDAEQTAANVQAMLSRMADGTSDDDFDIKRCFEGAAQLLQTVIDPLSDISQRLQRLERQEDSPPAEEVHP